MKIGPTTQSFPIDYQYGTPKYPEIEVEDKRHGKVAREHPAIAGLQKATIYVK
jgi:hypothetical protein